jgi:hypothetical protein
MSAVSQTDTAVQAFRKGSCTGTRAGVKERGTERVSERVREREREKRELTMMAGQTKETAFSVPDTICL